jgi:predicted metal-dependent hydrolase
MMRAIPGGFEVFIPRWMKEDSPKVRRFIQTGLEKLRTQARPEPAEQISREAIRVMVTQWAARLDVQPKRVTFREMTRKWGSCSSASHVTLNTRLCWLSPHLAEYVVLHELVHLKVFNHGKAFKSMMSDHMPDWEARERLLNTFTFS